MDYNLLSNFLSATKFRTAFLIGITICSLYSCQKNELPKLCGPSSEAIQYFEDDAFELTIRKVYEDPPSIYSSYQDSVAIPQTLFEKILTNLGAIYDNYEGAELDTIVRIQSVHAFPEYVNGQVIMILDRQEPWVQEFVQGAPITTNQLVRDTFERYNIEFNSTLFDVGTTLIIGAKTMRFVNIKALSTKLTALSGVTVAEPNFVFSFGPLHYDISIKFSLDNAFVDFQSNAGRLWRFSVDENCVPHFIGN